MKKTISNTPSGKLSTSGGFSLVETLVAIAIISIAVVAPMSLAQRSLFASVYARDEVTAFYLAQEAIEYARSVRDNNFLNGAPHAGWLSGLESCIAPNTCGVDITAPSKTFVCLPFNNNCRLTFSDPQKGGTGVYGEQSGNEWSNTIFTRTLQITPQTVGSDSNAEADMTASVYWQTGLIQRHITVNEKIFNWYR